MSPLDRHPLDQPVRVTRHLAALIDEADPACPIAAQYRPRPAEEAVEAEDDRPDPIGDGAHRPVPGIVHRYPDRALLMPVAACAAYCRFCFRRETVGRPPAGLSARDLEAALNYIEDTPGLWEVILSGGDPLLLSAERLRALIDRLNIIDHVKVLRVHTRLPVQDPDRLTDAHVAALAGAAKPAWLAVHVNHVRELTSAVEERLGALAASGVPLVAQTVLLRGVNDDAKTLEALFRRLVELRVKPYYLHHPDPAPGTAHFRPDIETGRAIMATLKGRLSGLALPTYVLDTPSGVGKWPLGPCA